MSRFKIVIIGGGSAYVPGILYSLTNAGECLSGSEVVLMDIDPSHLPLMSKLGQRMAKETRVDLRIITTTNLAHALEGANFIITNFRPGGLEALYLDESIPIKYGVLGQETQGPGGTFFALRSVPQVLSLCKSIEDICPDVWLMNYVNPTNFIADAIRRRSKVKAISICDGGGNWHGIKDAKLLGVKPEDVRMRAAGVNHHTFYMELRVKDKDGFPLLQKYLEQTPKDKIKPEFGTEFGDFFVWFFEKYGIYPANTSYIQPYFEYDAFLAKPETRSIYYLFMTTNNLPALWKDFEDMAENKKPIYMDRSKHHTDVGHGDLATQLILAIINNKTREFHVNVPNEGCISNLPKGAIVEVPALVDAGGVRPICMGNLPKAVAGFLQSIIVWQELSVDAALSGDKNLVIQALIAHPWVTSKKQQAEKICDEMLSEHSDYFPQFLEK